MNMFFFFFSSRRRHTRSTRDWSSDVCSSDLLLAEPRAIALDVTRDRDALPDDEGELGRCHIHDLPRCPARLARVRSAGTAVRVRGTGRGRHRLVPRDARACVRVGTRTAVRAGRIIDGSGDVRERATIVVEDGSIADVLGPDATVADANEIDASAKTVMPGFIA